MQNSMLQTPEKKQQLDRDSAVNKSIDYLKEMRNKRNIEEVSEGVHCSM